MSVARVLQAALSMLFVPKPSVALDAGRTSHTRIDAAPCWCVRAEQCILSSVCNSYLSAHWKLTLKIAHMHVSSRF